MQDTTFINDLIEVKTFFEDSTSFQFNSRINSHYRIVWVRIKIFGRTLKLNFETEIRDYTNGMNTTFMVRIVP